MNRKTDSDGHDVLDGRDIGQGYRTTVNIGEDNNSNISPNRESLDTTTTNNNNNSNNNTTTCNTNRSRECVYKRILSHDQKTSSRETSCRESLLRSPSCPSPPPYNDVTIQAPPTYKDLFPDLFRTFSQTDDHVTVQLHTQSSHLRNGSVVWERSFNCCKVVSLILCGCIVVTLLILPYLLSKKWGRGNEKYVA